MPLAITQVDAFTAVPFTGNPAAVCVLDRPAPERWMLAVANEMNLAETAFLVPDGPDSYGLRWFTPTVEVDLCGHATLAAAHVLWESGRLDSAQTARFSTRSGVLTATLGSAADPWITLDFPAQVIGSALPAVVEATRAALGLLSSDVASAWTGGADLIIEVDSPRVVRSIRPDFAGLGAVEARGIIVTSRADSDECDFVSRFFGPSVGVPEDPVTGSAHCALGPFWAERLGRNRLVGHQVSSRGGFVRVEVAGDRVRLGGQAVTVLRAELTASAGPL